MEGNTLTVRGLRTQFHTAKGILPAADGIDITVPGERSWAWWGNPAAARVSPPCR